MKVTKQDLVNILVKAMATAESVEVQTYSVAKMNKSRALLDENGNEVKEKYFDKKTKTEKERVVKVENELKDERVMRLQTIEYGFGGSYEQRVNEALAENNIEGEFKSQPLKWGKWVEGAEGAVISHTKDGVDKLYMRCYVKADGVKSNEYFVNGKSATESEIETIKQFAPNRTKDCSTQSEVGLEQGKQVIPNVVDFDNIIAITIEGVTYEVNDLKK